MEKQKPMRSHSQNARLLGERISRGDLDQYFNLDNDAMQRLAQSLSDENYDEIANCLIDNISSGGEGIEMVFAGAYDSQVEEQAGRIVSNYFRNIEVEAIESFKSQDLGRIREIIGKLESFPELKGFKVRKDKILNQLKEAEKKLSIPENLEKFVSDLFKEKGKNVSDIKVSKIIDSWGRSKKKAVVSWGKRGILTFRYLEKSIPKAKIPKLKFVPTKPEWKDKKPDQILNRKGEKFTLKERLFVQSRKNKSQSEIESDYYNVFGKVRPKSELKNLIGEFA